MDGNNANSFLETTDNKQNVYRVDKKVGKADGASREIGGCRRLKLLATSNKFFRKSLKIRGFYKIKKPMRNIARA